MGPDMQTINRSANSNIWLWVVPHIPLQWDLHSGQHKPLEMITMKNMIYAP